MPLVLTIMLGAALAALSSAMAVGTATETMIAGAYRDGTALLYAADAAAEFAIDELARSDWAHILDTEGRSTFIEEEAPSHAGASGPVGYALYASGAFGDMLSRSPLAVDPYVIVWVADLTDDTSTAAVERTAGIHATAFGPAGRRRSVALTARLTSADEGVIVERISWAQVP